MVPYRSLDTALYQVTLSMSMSMSIVLVESHYYLQCSTLSSRQRLKKGEGPKCERHQRKHTSTKGSSYFSGLSMWVFSTCCHTKPDTVRL